MIHILYKKENNQSWVSAHVLPNGQALIASRKYSNSTCPASGDWLGGSLVKCLNPSVDTCFIMNTDRAQSCPRKFRGPEWKMLQYSEKFRMWSRTWNLAWMWSYSNKVIFSWKASVGYIDVGDGCWRRNVFVTIIRCWWRFWPFWSPTFSIS